MRTDDFPNPVSDPEAAGLPATADDDSTAWDDVDTGREADGPDPAPFRWTVTTVPSPSTGSAPRRRRPPTASP